MSNALQNSMALDKRRAHDIGTIFKKNQQSMLPKKQIENIRKKYIFTKEQNNDPLNTTK